MFDSVQFLEWTLIYQDLHSKNIPLKKKKKKLLTGWLMHKSENGPVSRTGQSYPANKYTTLKKINAFYRFALPEAITL